MSARAARASAWLWPVLGACCAGAALVGLCVGASGAVPIHRVVAELVTGTGVVSELRAPRVVLASAVGAALSLSGVGMQALLANELAEPYVLGVSGGAALGAVLCLAALPSLPFGAGAAFGAVLTAWLVARMARRGSAGPARLLLCGVSVGSVLMSITGLILTLSPRAELVRSSSYWLFGGFAQSEPWLLALSAGAVVVCAGWFHRNARALDRLSLGFDVALALGLPVRRFSRSVLAVCVGLAALAVAVSGLVGFVGLVAPHAARSLVGGAHERLVPAACLLGVLFVLLSDSIARTAFAPREVPVGLVTALVGGPSFLILILKRDL